MKLERPKKRPLMISSSYARCPQLPITLSRIAIIRPKTVMVLGARGGAGGTSGWRVTGMSQVSAMLTGSLAKSDHDRVGVAPLNRWPQSGHHEGVPTGNS